MKKAYLISLLFLFTLNLLAQEPFVTTWKTTSDNESITIPTKGEGYNYSVDWGDGSYDSGIAGDAVHKYRSAGVYTVSISGDFPSIYFDFKGDKNKIKTIEQWGDIEWTSMESAFAGCKNLKYNAVDLPDLSNVTNMNYMFYNAESFNGRIGDWNVSTVTSMHAMFQNAKSFNSNISKWDVSAVTSMGRMFADADSFSQDLSSWDVSNVKYMFSMFQWNSSFNGDISMWDVSEVTRMHYMFYKAASFNQDLSEWNVENVKQMQNMFVGTSLLPDNYDKILIEWSTNPALEDSVNLGADGVYYCNSGDARSTLIEEFHWIISDAGQNCGYQILKFEEIEEKIYGESSFTLKAEASSGLPVTYTSSNKNVGNIHGNAVYIAGAGTANITAYQKGNENFNPTERITRELKVFKANQNITFDSIPAQSYWTSNVSLDGSSSSNLPVAYLSSNKEVAKIIGNTGLDLINEGTTIITAYQQGNDNYNSSDSVSHELLVVKNTITSVKDIENSNIQIFPNPVLDYFNISNIENFQYVRIYNEEGKLIEKYNSDQGEIKINLKAHQEGVYFIRLDNQDEVFKILKK